MMASARFNYALTSISLFASTTLLACGSGSIDGPEGEETASEFFASSVQGLVQGPCGVCHTTMAPIFWGPDPEKAMLESMNTINWDKPAESRLLTKETPHGGIEAKATGGLWTQVESDTILTWIAKVKEEQNIGMPPQTVESDAITPLLGQLNEISLEGLNAPGSKITFNYELVTNGAYISDLQVVAGPMGARVEHPLVVIVSNGTNKPDPADSFAGVDLQVPPNESRYIKGGILPLVNVPADAQLSFRFKSVGTSDGMGGNDGVVGCKAVPAFEQNARTPLANSCASAACHGGTVKGAIDLSMINTDAAATCTQVFARISLLNPETSGILTPPNPGSGTNHPFKFQQAQYDAFRTAILAWINAERAAAGQQ